MIVCAETAANAFVRTARSWAEFPVDHQDIPNLQNAADLYSNIVLWLLIAAGLIAVAIAAFSFLSSRKDNDLIRAKDRQLQLDLKDKDTQIESVKEKAQNDKLDSDGKIAALQATAAIATQKAAEANKTAEDEKNERLKLEAQIAPRRLTPAQQQEIAMACRGFSGRKVRVESYALDVEGGVLAKQIIAVLLAAKLNVDDGTASVMPLGGFSLAVHVNGDESDLVIGIASVLASVGKLDVAPPNSPLPQAPTLSVGGNPAAAKAVTVLVGVRPIK